MQTAVEKERKQKEIVRTDKGTVLGNKNVKNEAQEKRKPNGMEVEKRRKKVSLG